MRKVQLMRQAVLVALSLVGMLVLGGCSSMCDTYVRTYYQDCHGRYYIDQFGQRNYLYGSYYRGSDHGPYCHKDCRGRHYSKDSFGNVYYPTGRHC